jgi:hypothetical protein
MATTHTVHTKKAPPPRRDGDPTEQFRLMLTRSIDTYEKGVKRALEFELKFAEMTQQEWLKELIERQADFTREVVSTYAKATRTLLK